MHAVRAMFRVLTSTRGIDYQQITLAPTYATRDGKQCEENRSFWNATPSGQMELTVPVDAACVAFFEPGSYVFLDFTDAATEPPDGCVSPITVWYVAQVAISGTAPGQRQPNRTVVVDLAPKPSGHTDDARVNENGLNHWLFGTSWARGSIHMQIENPGAFPLFDIRPGDERVICLGFRPA